MYESEEIYYTGDYEGGEVMEEHVNMDVTEDSIYYQDNPETVETTIEMPPGPSNMQQQQQFHHQHQDLRKPRVKRDYTEQKKQTVRLRKTLDEGTLQRMTRTIHPIRPGQLGMIFRRLKKSNDVLQQLPEKVQLEEIGPSGLKDEQEEKLENLRNDPEALYELLSGLKLETGVKQEEGDYDDDGASSINKRVIYDQIGKYKIRPPGYDLKNVTGITPEHITSTKNYQRIEETFNSRLMNKKVQLDIKLCQFLNKKLSKTPKFMKKTIFVEPEYGCTETCARIRPVIKYFSKPNLLSDITNDVDTKECENHGYLTRNHPKVDPYTLEKEISSDVLNAYEMHRRAIIHPALNKVTMNIRTLERQRVGLEKEKPRTSLSNKLLKKDKTSKFDEPQTSIEPMKMVIKRIPSQIPGKKKVIISPTNRYQISSKIQHPPAHPIIPKKKPRKSGPRNQYKDWD